MRIAPRHTARQIKRRRTIRATLKAAGILALVLLTAAAGISAAYVGVELGQREQAAVAPELVNPNRSIWI